MNAVPGDEAVALMGSEELALQYDEGLVRLDPIPNKSRVTVIAMNNDHVVGVLQYQFGDAPHHSRVDVLKLLLKVLGPIGLLRLRRRFARGSRLTSTSPPTHSRHELPRGSRVLTGRASARSCSCTRRSEARRIGARNMSLTTIPDLRRRPQVVRALRLQGHEDGEQPELREVHRDQGSRVPGEGARPGRADVRLVGSAQRVASPTLARPTLGRLAQSGERLPYKQEVVGSSPAAPTHSLTQ